MEKYIELASQELRHPTFATTQQYLQVMSMDIKGENFVVERVDESSNNEFVTVFFCLDNELFFMAVKIEKATEQIDFVWIQSACAVYITATSEELSYQELKAILPLKNTTGFSKGDTINQSSRKYLFSRISYAITESMAYDVEELLEIVLADLEKNKQTMETIIKQANCTIAVLKYQYISSNAGLHLSAEALQKIAKWNIPIDIDTYIVGNPIQ